MKWKYFQLFQHVFIYRLINFILFSYKGKEIKQLDFFRDAYIIFRSSKSEIYVLFIHSSTLTGLFTALFTRSST